MKATQPASGADPGIVSNKDWQEGKYNGFILSLRYTTDVKTADVKFNVGDGKNRMDFTRPLPTDYASGWMHVILSVDRTNKKVRIWYDFVDGDEMSIPDALTTVSFVSTLSFNIGQDGTGSLSYKLPAQLDELIITADAFTQADVAALKAHYN